MSVSEKTKELVGLKYNGRCAYTGTKLLPDWQVDHIKPIILGGTDDIDNLMPCQKLVNHYKRALPLELFRTWFLAGLHLRLRKLPKNPQTIKSLRHNAYMLQIAILFDITPDKPFSGKFYFETI